jgi:hypothetical protein
MTAAEILHRLKGALLVFCERDRYLLTVDANERSISHKIAEYLQPEFEDWNVDCEYNRDGHEPKALTSLPQFRGPEGMGSRVFPDIIVHRRGQRGAEGNLLVIEVKKSQDESGIEADTVKLECYLGDLDYRYAVLLSCVVGNEQPDFPFELTFFDPREIGTGHRRSESQ